MFDLTGLYQLKHLEIEAIFYLYNFLLYNIIKTLLDSNNLNLRTVNKKKDTEIGLSIAAKTSFNWILITDKMANQFLADIVK